MKLAVPTAILALAACQSTPPPIAEAAEAPTVVAPAAAAPAPVGSAPLDAEGRYSTALEYLVTTHDANGDGAVDRSEYTRSDEAFATHDHDQDGTISSADFDAELLAQRKRRQRAQTRALPLVAWGFQADAEPERLLRDELALAFDSYDEDGDGDIGTREFEAHWAERQELGLAPTGSRKRMVERSDPWDVLLGAADLDDDGRLTDVELLTWFDGAAGPDGDLAALIDEPGDQPEGGVVRATEGEPAPDFTLPTPAGTEWFTLSSFRGDRPVALIFGSYT